MLEAHTAADGDMVSPPSLQDITVLNIFNGALISDTVATNYTMAKLFGSRKVDLLRQLRTVPVAG